jgi:hypothetical protein
MSSPEAQDDTVGGVIQPVQRLYSHALESIFAMLTFTELNATLTVCRAWMAAVCSMRGLVHGGNLKWESRHRVCELIVSRMLHHVSTFGKFNSKDTYWAFGSIRIENAIMLQLKRSTPWLRELNVSLVDPTWDERIKLPGRLERVSLEFHPCTSAESIQAAIFMVSAHRHLTLCRLSVSSAIIMSHLSFEPLQHLLTLKELVIHTMNVDRSCRVTLTSAQVAQVRALRQLECFNCTVTNESMVSLLQPLPSGQHLRWTRLNRYELLGEGVSALFGSLPCLRTLHIGRNSRLTNLNHLAQLPSLASVYLFTATATTTTTTNNILLSLHKPLPSVRKFTLDHASCSTAQLTTFWQYFPFLSHLTLMNASGIESLTFLEPVRTTLRTLRLLKCGTKFCPSSAVLLLLTHFHLTHLVIDDCFTERLTSDHHTALQAQIPTFQS